MEKLVTEVLQINSENVTFFNIANDLIVSWKFKSYEFKLTNKFFDLGERIISEINKYIIGLNLTFLYSINFHPDVTDPVIVERVAVPSPTNTASYTFHSSEPGTISASRISGDN